MIGWALLIALVAGAWLAHPVAGAIVTAAAAGSLLCGLADRRDPPCR